MRQSEFELRAADGTILQARLWEPAAAPQKVVGIVHCSGGALGPVCRDHRVVYPQVAQQYRQDPLVHRRVSAILGTSMLDAATWALEHAHQLTIPLLLMRDNGVPR
jgi:hypothetical protein